MVEEQRKRAKDASIISGSIFVTNDLDKIIQQLPVTEFVGYDRLQSKSTLLWAQQTTGARGVMILDKTPCYAESGGQVGDEGIAENESFKAKIVTTQQKD